MIDRKIRVKTTGRDFHTAYVALPGHRSEPGIVSKTVDLASIVTNYKGPRVLLDFSKDHKLIGIEILVSGDGGTPVPQSDSRTDSRA